jgi:hypothetical protein
MTMRIAVWLCVLIGLSGCGASLAEPSDVASDDLGLQNEEGAKDGASPVDEELDRKKGAKPAKDEAGAKEEPGAAKSEGDPKKGREPANGEFDPKKGPDPAKGEGVATRCESSTKPGDAEVEDCYVKAKRCYIDSEDSAHCDELLKHCSTLAGEPPKPAQDDCSVQIEGCLKSAKDPEECAAVKVTCVKSPPPSKPAETTSAFEACWRKYKDCYAEGNDPASCESFGESCKTLDNTGLQ